MSVKTISNLIYEEMDGVPIYYKSYYKILLSEASPEDIMGSSHSQTMVISAILGFLYKNIPNHLYWIATNEAGLNISRGNNLAADIAIFDRKKLKPNHRDFHYIKVPPNIVIEVDIKADLSDFSSPLDYYRTKSRKLKEFGVEMILWVDTKSETLMVDDKIEPRSWNTPVTLLEGIEINIGELVKQF